MRACTITTDLCDFTIFIFVCVTTSSFEAMIFQQCLRLFLLWSEFEIPTPRHARRKRDVTTHRWRVLGGNRPLSRNCSTLLSSERWPYDSCVCGVASAFRRRPAMTSDRLVTTPRCYATSRRRLKTSRGTKTFPIWSTAWFCVAGVSTPLGLVPCTSRLARPPARCTAWLGVRLRSRPPQSAVARISPLPRVRSGHAPRPTTRPAAEGMRSAAGIRRRLRRSSRPADLNRCRCRRNALTPCAKSSCCSSDKDRMMWRHLAGMPTAAVDATPSAERSRWASRKETCCVSPVRARTGPDTNTQAGSSEPVQGPTRWLDELDSWRRIRTHHVTNTASAAAGRPTGPNPDQGNTYCIVRRAYL